MSRKGALAEAGAGSLLAPVAQGLFERPSVIVGGIVLYFEVRDLQILWTRSEIQSAHFGARTGFGNMLSVAKECI